MLPVILVFSGSNSFNAAGFIKLPCKNTLHCRCCPAKWQVSSVGVDHPHTPSFMNETFRERVNMYNLRNNNELVLPRIQTVNFGSESIRYRRPQLWFSLPEDIGNTESLSLFKSKIKKWHGEVCSCRLCRPVNPNVGFL